MARTMLAAIFVVIMFSSLTWAQECRVYEYAEIQSMSESEMAATVAQYNKKSIQLLRGGNRMAELGQDVSADSSYAESKQCSEESARIGGIRAKKFPGAIKSRMTLSECREKLKNVPDGEEICQRGDRLLRESEVQR